MGKHVICNVTKVTVQTVYLDDEEAEAIRRKLSFDGVNYIERKSDSKNNRTFFNVIVNTQLVQSNAYENLEYDIDLILRTFNKSEGFIYELTYKEA